MPFVSKAELDLQGRWRPSRPVDGELVAVRGVDKGASPGVEQLGKVVPRRGSGNSEEGVCGQVGGEQGEHRRELEDGYMVKRVGVVAGRGGDGAEEGEGMWVSVAEFRGENECDVTSYLLNCDSERWASLKWSRRCKLCQNRPKTVFSVAHDLKSFLPCVCSTRHPSRAFYPAHTELRSTSSLG
jgi:hypothetical protein